jgi:Xaa-Pro aminopeptidase
LTIAARILGQLPELRLDSLIVSALPNVRYLSGFTGSNAVLLIGGSRPVLFTDPRYAIQAQEQAPGCAVRIVRGSLLAAALKLVAKKKWRQIGFEAGPIAYSSYGELHEGLTLGAELKATAGLVEQYRMIKSDEEVALIRRAVETNSRAFANCLKSVRPGMAESDLAAKLEYQMRVLGAEKAAFETIVASGPRTALPHAHPTSNPLKSGELLLVDMGAMQAGYASDMTRMLHLGKPGAKARALYKAVLEAQLAGVSAVRANITAGAVDRKTRQVLKAHGLEKAFVHSTGHGLGLEIHEAPRVGKKDATTLLAGMVITIEPGAYVEGFGGVRIEDTVLVTENGCEVLTPTPKELIVV